MQKKLLMLLLIFVFSGLLFFSGCKTTEEHVYDIRGSWSLTTIVDTSSTFVFVFSGSLTGGIVSCAEFSSGTYTVNDNQVTIVMYFGALSYTFTGTFSNDNYMSGNLTFFTATGTWFATR
jgi:hypothetical protein